MAVGQIPVSNLVFVSHLNQAARHRDYACNSEYTAFLIEELLPWAKSQQLAAGEVLLAGLSLSGLAAAFAGVRHPDVFQRVLCQSPSAWWNNEWLEKEIHELADIPARFWISVGSIETETNVRHAPTDMHQVTSQLESCRRLADTLGERSTTQFSIFEGGHEMRCWENELPAAMRWLNER